MTLEYLTEKYIERTGYGMDMWSKEENSTMETISKILEEESIKKNLQEQLLKECRDLLIMCSLIDKSNNCNELVNKVDNEMGWK